MLILREFSAELDNIELKTLLSEQMLFFIIPSMIDKRLITPKMSDEKIKFNIINFLMFSYFGFDCKKIKDEKERNELINRIFNTIIGENFIAEYRSANQHVCEIETAIESPTENESSKTILTVLDPLVKPNSAIREKLSMFQNRLSMDSINLPNEEKTSKFSLSVSCD